MKKSQIMSVAFTLGLLFCSSIFLSGCATTFNKKTGVFRNRDLDYLHQPIHQSSGLIIPSGVEKPQLNPKNKLPAGPNSYPAESTVDMTPPGFNKNIPISAPSSAPKATTQTPTTPSSNSSSKSEYKPKTSEEINAEIAAIQAQIQHIKNHQNQSSQPQPSAPASTKLTTEATTQEAPQITQKLPGISSSLTFDTNNHGLLNINAPFNEAWNALKTAVTESGYTISKVDKGSHLIYVSIPTITSEASASISAAETAPKASTYLLFVTRKDNVTQVSVFTDKGVLDSSTSAYSLLSQLHGILNSPPSS
jgi:uncharacterized lipoprotein